MAERYPYISSSLDINIIDSNINIFNKKTKKSYLLGENEYSVLINADGTRSVEDLSRISKKFSVEQISSLLRQYESMGLINDVNIKEKRRFFNHSFSLCNGNVLFKSDGIITKLLYFILVYLSLIIFVIGFFVFMSKIGEFHIINENYPPWFQIITNLLSFIIIAAIHELSHAVVARKLNVNVPEIGVKIYYFLPLVYTNLSFIRLLKSKSQRIICLWAGLFSNFFLSGVAFLITSATQGNVSLFFERIAILNLALVVANLMVFFKLDGYFIFQELIEESNLREKAILHVRNVLLHFIGAIRSKKKKTNIRYQYNLEERENKVFYFIFGVLCIFYVPILILSTVWGLISYIV